MIVIVYACLVFSLKQVLPLLVILKWALGIPGNDIGNGGKVNEGVARDVVNGWGASGWWWGPSGVLEAVEAREPPPPAPPPPPPLPPPGLPLRGKEEDEDNDDDEDDEAAVGEVIGTGVKGERSISREALRSPKDIFFAGGSSICYPKKRVLGEGYVMSNVGLDERWGMDVFGLR